MIEEKQDKEKDLIEIIMVEEIVFKRFYKYLKIFGKKKLEKILMKKTWDYIIDIKEGFIPKKRKIYSFLRIEKKKIQKFVKNQLKKRYI